MTWDPVATARLADLTAEIDAAGLTRHVRRTVARVWRHNVERYDPDQVADDLTTLGFTAARNVSNSLYRELRGPRGLLQPLAEAVTEHQSTTLKVAGLEVHLVKAPGGRGRNPRFQMDFDWEDREGRRNAARRNFRAYNPPRSVEGVSPLFDIAAPQAEQRVLLCRDVFIVWAGDLDGRTAGWYGLPTTADGSWLAVQPAWFDGDADVRERRDGDGGTDGVAFSQLKEAKPAIALKPGVARGVSDG